uniref:Lipid droplet-associated hydrolase n=1 Tax=Oncorhynchus tshawytscha TaxID=74940 RepID=A0A8C8MJI8_ONCTS
MWSCKIKLVQLTMKIGNPGVIGFYMTFMQTLHQTLGWCSPVWAVTHAGHCVPPDTMDVIDGTYSNCWTHKLVFLSEHIPRDTYLVLMGHSVSCYIILEMLTLDPELQVVKSVMLFPTIERMAVTPQGRLLTPVLCHLHLCSLPARLPPLSAIELYYTGCVARLMCQGLQTIRLQRELWMFCHSYVQLVFYYGACDHWYHVQYHQETKRDFPNGDIRLCSRGIRHALVLDTGKEVADMIVEWIHGNLQTWS